MTDSVQTNTTVLPLLSRSDIVGGSTLVEALTKEEANATITNIGRDEDGQSDNITVVSNTSYTTQSLEENILPRQNQFSNPNMFDQEQGEVGTTNYDYEYTDDISATDGNSGEDFSENYPTNNPEPVNPALLLGKLLTNKENMTGIFVNFGTIRLCFTYAISFSLF